MKELMLFVIMVLLIVVLIAVVALTVVALFFSYNAVKLTQQLWEREEEIRELKNELNILKKEKKQ